LKIVLAVFEKLLTVCILFVFFLKILAVLYKTSSPLGQDWLKLIRTTQKIIFVSLNLKRKCQMLPNAF